MCDCIINSWGKIPNQQIPNLDRVTIFGVFTSCHMYVAVSTTLKNSNYMSLNPVEPPCNVSALAQKMGMHSHTTSPRWAEWLMWPSSLRCYRFYKRRMAVTVSHRWAVSRITCQILQRVNCQFWGGSKDSWREVSRSICREKVGVTYETFL